MKRRIILALLVLVAFLNAEPVSGGKSTLKWLKFDTAVSEAVNQKKKILVDVYTDWCGWCKKMDSGTYGDAAVSTYLTTNYIVVKFNAESPDKVNYRGETYSHREFTSAFGIRGFPATLFLTSSGDPITVLPGYVKADDFLKVLRYIAEDHYLTKRFDEYRDGRQ